jgi:hypothetical protein
MVGKKLVVVQLLPELDEGGVEGETIDLSAYLANQGHKSIVISGGGRLVPLVVENGGIHIHWPFIGEKSFRCLQYILKLKRFLLQENVDILHLRSRLPAWIGYLAWKLIPEKKKTATDYHISWILFNKLLLSYYGQGRKSCRSFRIDKKSYPGELQG